MTKKLQRVFRNRRLTPEEVAEDADVRARIEREFLPLAARNSAQANSLSELLRRSILESGLSFEEIAKDAGVSSILIASFVAGERDIHMATADRLAFSLGLEVTAES